MKQMIAFCALLLITCCMCLSVLPVVAQDTFKNPAMEPQDDFQKAFNAARRLAREGKGEDAIKEVKKAAKLRNDQCAECFQLLAQIHFQMAKYKDAAAAFRQAIALKPDNEAGLNNSLGVALYLQGDKKSLEEAAAALNRAIELSGGKIVKAYYNLGYALIKLRREQEGIQALKTYLEVDPSSANANEVRAVIANPRRAFEKVAPDFKVTSTGGDELSLEKYRGRVVLLDFWATWCLPCRAEMPEVKKIWKKYGGESFVIIGVSLDSDEQAFEEYVKKEEMTWPQYFDGRGWNNKVSRLYEVNSIPHTVLIDGEGVVRAIGYRGGELSNKIGDLLKKLQKQSSDSEKN